jgi:hypothetical protein
MSESPAIPDLTGFPTVIYVIDGEIVDVMVLSPTDERRTAILSSSPQIYMLDGGFPASGAPPRIGSPWPLS